MFKRSPCLKVHVGKKIILACCPKIFYEPLKKGQYKHIIQTACSDFKVLSRDRVSNIPFEMHMSMLSWDPTLGCMQCLAHHKFLEYLLGVEHERVGMQMAEDQFLMSS